MGRGAVLFEAANGLTDFGLMRFDIDSRSETELKGAAAGRSLIELAVSPGDQMVALTTGRSIHLFDLKMGKEIRQFGAWGEAITRAEFARLIRQTADSPP